MLTVFLLVASSLWGPWGSAAAPTNAAVTPVYDAAIEGPISEGSLSGPLRVITRAARDRKPVVNIKFNSPGGDAFAMLDFLVEVSEAKSRGLKINCWADGALMSAAFFIYQDICDVRNITGRTVVLAHGVSTQLSGNQVDIETDLALIKVLNNIVANMTCARMGMTREAWDVKTLGRDWWFDGLEAKALKAADNVVTPNQMPTKFGMEDEGVLVILPFMVR